MTKSTLESGTDDFMRPNNENFDFDFSASLMSDDGRGPSLGRGLDRRTISCGPSTGTVMSGSSGCFAVSKPISPADLDLIVYAAPPTERAAASDHVMMK